MPEHPTALPAQAGIALVLLARPGPLPVPFAELGAEAIHLAGLDHRGVACGPHELRGAIERVELRLEVKLNALVLPPAVERD